MRRTFSDRSGVRPRAKVGFEKTSNADDRQHPVAIAPTKDSPFSKARGSATVRMRTDEIMRLVRGVD